MAERVLIASYPHMPGPADVPALRAIVEHLERASYEVTTVNWPYLKGEEAMAPTWEAAAQAIAKRLQPGDHVIAFGCAIPIALVGVQRASIPLSSLIFVTLALPSATLEALGTPAMARVGSQSCASTSFRWVRHRLSLMMQGAPPAQIDACARRFMEQVDVSRHDAFLQSHESLDLTEEIGEIDLPALYFELTNDSAETRVASDVGVLLPRPEGEDRALLTRFMPGASFKLIDVFPTKLHEPEAGREIWEPAIAFMKQSSAKRSSVLPAPAP